jgi:hypothetical protein
MAKVAATNYKKAQVLQDQAALSLLTMPEDAHLSAQACKYLELRREQEMTKLHLRIDAMKAEVARARAKAEREARSRAAKVEAVTVKRIPPAPILPVPSPRL